MQSIVWQVGLQFETYCNKLLCIVILIRNTYIYICVCVCVCVQINGQIFHLAEALQIMIFKLFDEQKKSKKYSLYQLSKIKLWAA